MNRIGKGRLTEICRVAAWILCVAAMLLMDCNLHLRTMIEKSREELAKVKSDIDQIAVLRRILPAVLDDMAVSATTNKAMYDLFTASGYWLDVHAEPVPPPAPGGSP